MKPKLKVCHVLSGFFRNDSRIFHRQCKSLKHASFEVSILTNDGLPEEFLEGIKIYSCDTLIQSRIKVLFSAKSQFLAKALEVDADVYQLHGPELIPLGLELKRKGKIIFYDAHEDLPRDILEKEWIPSVLRKPVSLIADQYLKVSLRKFDEVITVTPHIAKNLAAITKNVTVVPNFPVYKAHTPFSLDAYLQRGDVLCYTGTVYRYSNQRATLDSIADLPTVQYRIAGVMDDELKAELSQHPAFSRVDYLGRIDQKELGSFYNKATMGIVLCDYRPNLGYKEGSLGVNKFFEYMGAGLPLICTDFALWKNIIEKYDCGICVEPNNVAQIREAISFLINNKERAFQMGQNGRRAIEEEFSWGHQEGNYIRLFQEYHN